MQQSLRHMVALSVVPKVGAIMAKYLIAYCGGVEEVFDSSAKQLAKIPQIGPAIIKNLKDESIWDRAEEQLDFIDTKGIRAYCYLDDDYPRRLKHFDTSPIVLYFNGGGELNHHRTVGIIGTRKPTDRGRLMCEKLVAGLARYDVQIISGLAHGIDSLAHKYAVDEAIPTIGVLGHGHDIIYPATNRSLAQKMLPTGGTLSQFCIKSRIDKEHFPMRNRIIAAMSDAVIVVESARKGGSMITAEFANQYNKDVFAMPGRTTDPWSEGCNKLIKQHKANLLESASDVGYIMRWEEADTQKTVQATLFVELDDLEQKVIDILREKPQTTIDELNYHLQLSTSALASCMINLEFKGAIKSLPGKKYMVV